MKAEKTRGNIIHQTIELIKESSGDIEAITIRRIAERAGVGIGLIHHYFRSKDFLIEVCVQTIIEEVIHSFRPEACESSDPIEITKCVAKQVMDFLMENRHISKVSILADFNRPSVSDNTIKTVMGFGRSLSGGRDIGPHKIHSFMITSVLQAAFLRKDLLQDCIGVDFNEKSQRDRFIDIIVERFGGNEIFNT